MGTTRTAWHVLLAALLREFGPHRFEVRTEVPLSKEPLRVDYLFLRRTSPSDDPPRTLGRLWDLLPQEAVAEFKSIGRPYRSRNLDKLLSYLHLHYAEEPARLKQRSDLAGVLLVLARTPSLDADVAGLGLTWHDLGGGYWQLKGGAFTLYVLELLVIAKVEDDDLLRLLCYHESGTARARRWLSQQLGAQEIAMVMHELEGYDEVISQLVEGLPPEHVLAVNAPEQAVVGLTPEQRVGGLAPDNGWPG